jgi:hypothetical protein
VVHPGKSNTVSHHGDYGGVEEWLQVFLNSAEDEVIFTLQLSFETCHSRITQCVNVSLTRVVRYVSAGESFGTLWSSPEAMQSFVCRRVYCYTWFSANSSLMFAWVILGRRRAPESPHNFPASAHIYRQLAILTEESASSLRRRDTLLYCFYN